MVSRFGIEEVREYFSCQRKCLSVVYRIVTCLYSLAALVAWIVVANSYLEYMAIMYLTTWTYIVQCLYTVLAAIGPFYFTTSTKINQTSGVTNPTHNSDETSEGDINHLPDTRDDNTMQNANLNGYPYDDKCNQYLSIFICLAKEGEQQTQSINRGHHVFLLLWSVTASIHSVFGFIVTGVYYGMLCYDDHACDNFENINVHGLNSVFIIIDLLCCRPVSFFQTVYPIVYGFLYIVFSVIAWATDHSIVMYIILDWNRPGPSVGWTFLILVMIVFVQSVICLIKAILRKCCNCNSCYCLATEGNTQNEMTPIVRYSD